MEIHFEIENRCLLECRHCSSFAQATGNNQEYSVLDMIRFLNLFGSVDKQVFLTGGEPLLHPDITYMIETLKENTCNTKIGLFTSGIVDDGVKLTSVSDELAYDLSTRGVSCCYLSVYCSDAQGHDWMTGVSGSFGLTQQSIRILKKNDIDVRFNTVVTAVNADRIMDIIKLAEDWEVSEVRLLKLIRHGRAIGSWNEIEMNELQYRDLVNRVRRIKTNVNITVSGMEDVIPCRKFCKVGECPAGKKLWYVTYKGEIFPCASVKNNPSFCVGTVSDDMLKNKIMKNTSILSGGMLCRSL